MLKHRSALSDVDLNLLYTFRIFVEQGNLQRTARSFGRSQPAITARLQQLQRDLGVALLQRSGRRLQLTPIGRTIADELRALFTSAQRIIDHARASTREPAGLLRVGALHTVGAFILAPQIARLRRRFAKVEIDLTYGLAAPLLELLRGGQLDMVVAVGTPPGGSLVVTTVGKTRPVLVMAKKKSRLPRQPLALRHLEALDWVGYGRIGDAFFDQVSDFLEQSGIDERIRVRVSNIQTLKLLVAAGAGATILPDYTVTERELNIRRVNGLDAVQPIWMATRPALADVPVIAEFASLIKKGAPAATRS